MGCAGSQDLGTPMHSTTPKNLFEGSEHELKGEYLPGMEAQVKGMISQYPNDMQFNAEWALSVRPNFNKMFGAMMSPFKVFEDQCNVELLEFDGTEYGTDRKDMYMHKCTPKKLKDQNPAAIVYIHGSGFLFFDAKMFPGEASRIAIANNCVVYNVDYRKAPEDKNPAYINDSYASLKYILATQTDIDKNRIALHGTSAGGHMVIGIAMRLAQDDRQDDVRLIVPHIAAMSATWLDYTKDNDYKFEGKELNWVQKGNYNGHVDIYKLMSTDWGKQFKEKDPELFPGNMPDELLQKVPPMYLTTGEWDHYRLDNEWLAERMRKVAPDKLLGLWVEAGQIHGSINHDETSKIFSYYMGTARTTTNDQLPKPQMPQMPEEAQEKEEVKEEEAPQKEEVKEEQAPQKEEVKEEVAPQQEQVKEEVKEEEAPKVEPKEEVPKEEVKEEAPQEEPKEEAPQEEPKEEAPQEAPQEEPKEEAPQEEPKEEAPQEAPKEEVKE